VQFPKPSFVEESIAGKYTWNHNGSSKNGTINLNFDGTITSDCGWNGIDWYEQKDGTYIMNFNGIRHKMVLADEKKKAFVLIEPLRFPPSTMVIDTTFT